WILRFEAFLVASSMRHTRKCLEREIMGFMSQFRALHQELTNRAVFTTSAALKLLSQNLQIKA
ncbi:hypothetical protein, partial [Pseudomonas kulmbachensis]|uniref:hypothetical protein n=1 Tax=Pseudomonas kulmbachensis TaxID=3043408 RepID=UPI0037551104